MYKSEYTDQPITAAQFLSEFICQRIAQKEGKVLKYKFWNEPSWNKIFRRQIVAANTLLKEAECLQIMSFLRSKKGQKIYSLGLKKPILDGCKSFTIPVFELVEDSQGKVMCELCEFGDFSNLVKFSEESNKTLWKKLNAN